MLEEFKEQRNQIRFEMINNQNYQYSKILCKSFIKMLKESSLSKEELKEDLWVSHYNLALSEKKLGNIRESFVNAQKSIQYSEFRSDDHKYMYSLWLIAECHLQLDNKDEAIYTFHQCISMFKIKNDQEFRMLSLFNIALSHKSIYMMKRIIRIYESSKLKKNLPTYGDMKKDEMLEEMYINLVKLYKENKDTESIFQILHIIKDTNLRKTLMKLMVA